MEILSGNGALLGPRRLAGRLHQTEWRSRGEETAERRDRACCSVPSTRSSAEGIGGCHRTAAWITSWAATDDYEKELAAACQADQWQGFANVGKLGRTIEASGDSFSSRIRLRRDGRARSRSRCTR